MLFVSHNMAAISEMATRAVLLNEGQVEIDGEVSRAISTYLSRGAGNPVYECGPDQSNKRPHVSRAEVITSDANGIHRFGEALEVKFCIRHTVPLSRGCFSFQILNQLRQPVVHAWALYPQARFGTHRGKSVLVCRFPSLRLNVGKFHLRTYLTEPPGGDVYERLDDISPFEVVRTDEAILFGWHSETCAYHEKWEWTIENAQSWPAHEPRPIEGCSCRFLFWFVQMRNKPEGTLQSRTMTWGEFLFSRLMGLWHERLRRRQEHVAQESQVASEN